MASPLPTEPSPLNELPPDLLDAVTSLAVRSADAAASLLTSVGLTGTPEKPVRLDAGFLLEISSAMVLIEWEKAGLFLHRAAGLPSARDLIASAFNNAAERGSVPPEIQVRQKVLALFVERFAWHGRPQWNAPLAIDYLPDDALDAIAEFLWENRVTKGTA